MSKVHVTAALLAAVASAGYAAPELPRSITDGPHITLEEVRRNSGKVFQAFAGPSGGPVPEERFVSMQLPQGLAPRQPDGSLLRTLFQRLDADGNGELSRQEWDDALERDLAFIDENEDGAITMEELAKARQNLGVGDVVGMLF